MIFSGNQKLETNQELIEVMKKKSFWLKENNFTSLQLRTSKNCLVINCCSKFIAFKSKEFTIADLKQ